MGFTTGFIGGATLTTFIFYLSLSLHERNRLHQAALLRQQSLVLNTLVYPQPPRAPPTNRLERASLAENLKDRWNAELEGNLKKLYQVDWSGLRENAEERVGGFWASGLKGSREGAETAGHVIDEKVREAGHVVGEKAKEAGVAAAENARLAALKTRDAGYAAAERTKEAGVAAGEKAHEAGIAAREKAHEAGIAARENARAAASRAREAGHVVSEKAHEVGVAARENVKAVASKARDAAVDAKNAGQRAVERVKEGVEEVRDTEIVPEKPSVVWVTDPPRLGGLIGGRGTISTA